MSGSKPQRLDFQLSSTELLQGIHRKAQLAKHILELNGIDGATFVLAH